MPTPAKTRFWRLCRIYFRRFRISIWVLTIVVLSALLYLNRVGLPDFVKRPLVNKLREHGIALEFVVLRLHWSEGFVAYNVSFGSMNKPAAPQLLAEQVVIKLHPAALLRGQLQVDALDLRGGRLQWTPANSQTPLRALTVQNIQARLRLLPGDQWRLDDLHARFAGADIVVSASITNATAVRDWAYLRGTEAAPVVRWPERLQRLADTLESISFSSPPELRLVVEGDARDRRSFGARLNINAAQADTPWGRAETLECVSRIFPAASNELSRAELTISAATAQTPWANTTNLNLQLHLVSLSPQPELVDVSLTLRTDAAETPWATVGNTGVKAHWVHALTNPIPISGQVEFNTDLAVTRWARAARVHFAGDLTPATNSIPSDASLAWWTNLLPYQLEWSAEVGALNASRLAAEEIVCAGRWSAPELAITRLRANLYRGTFAAAAQLDVGTRELDFNATSDFDVRQFARLLLEPPPDWLGQWSGTEPPHLRGAGTLLLPEWTNRSPDWGGQVRPTLQWAGEIALTNAVFQGLYAHWLHTHLTCTNLFWSLPDLTVGRPEGRLRAALTADERTREFYSRFDSTIDVSAPRAWFGAEVRQGLELCEFTAPPVIAGELWGRGDDPDRLGFRGSVALTNFTFRALNTDAIVTDLRFTNRVIEFLEPRLWRGTQALAAAGIVADFNAQRIYFTNGFSTLDPGPVTRAIGPPTDEVMAPYHFLEPPVVHFEGYAPMADANDVDLHFDAVAGPFACLKFRVPRVTGQVHWVTNTLTVTNVQADFYEGAGQGWTRFVFPEEAGSKFTFSVNVTNTNLRLLMADLYAPTNNLDGLLSLNLVITDANTDNPHSWNGFGQAQLRDGLIWEIPVFGVLSKPLDTIMPGVGNSRVAEATATFVISNSVIQSEDLEMRAPTLRLQYRGTADFQGQVKARVTVEPLRNTPVLGPVMNVALWPVSQLFAYKITGSLADPKSEPVYIPKILLLPFSPFKTLGELFAPLPTGTNAPPEIKVGPVFRHP
jgi:hypothetical protein